MICFNYDYSKSTHEHILDKLVETDPEQTPGYEEDPYCEEAAAIIREPCQKEDVGIHFLVGDTQANATVTASALGLHQGATGAVTAHVNVHEMGAVEATGHKILSLSSIDGKITASQVKGLYLACIGDENFEHIVQPGMVYISNPTELGAIYTRTKLEALYRMCGTWGLYLFMNGVRLVYGLAVKGDDVDLKVLVSNCDVFYIGETKVDILPGGTVMITNEELKEDFRYRIKQRDRMLARGRLLGIQFGGPPRDGLYTELGRHGDRMANKVRKACWDKEIPLLVTNTTSQAFSIMPDTLLEQWKDKYSYINQGRADETHMTIRLCTSWAISEEYVDTLAKDILDN